MAIYSRFNYGDGTLYGDSGKVPYSAEPFSVTAVGSDIINSEVRPKVEVSWSRFEQTVYGFRVVRNQEGFPENEEDGEVIFESYANINSSGTISGNATPSNTVIYDQTQGAALTPGKYAYYAIWVMIPQATENVWAISARGYCLIPKEHHVVTPDGTVLKTATKKFVELMPKVFTTSQQSYLDEVDETSDLYYFLDGFSYTLDEILTFTDVVPADISGEHTNPNVIDLQMDELGLHKEPTLGMRSKKSLIRNALKINSTRGSLSSIGLFASSLTGFGSNPNITPNLMLSLQDSTFYKGIGNWAKGSNVTSITSSTDSPVQSEVYSVDRQYIGTVVTSGTNGVISLGANSPTLKGIPVTAGYSYELTWYMKNPANVTPAVTWYDRTGASLSTSTGTAISSASSYTRRTLSVTAPSNALFMSISLTFASANTYFVDMFQVVNTTINDASLPYYEPRGVLLTLQPTKINLIQNPSLVSTSESSSVNWSTTGIGSGNKVWTNAGTVPGIFDGTNMLTLTTTSSTAWTLSIDSASIPRTGGFYVFSIYTKTTSGSENVSIKLDVYDTTSTIIGTTTSSNLPVTSAWSRKEVYVYVPPTQGTVFVRVTISGPGSGNVLNFDAAQLEMGLNATDYFTGSMSSKGARWMGTVNNSVSIMHRNKDIKVNRLVAEIPEYIPMNSSYVILSGYSSTNILESSGFSS